MHTSRYLHRRSHTPLYLISPISALVMEARVGYRRVLWNGPCLWSLLGRTDHIVKLRSSRQQSRDLALAFRDWERKPSYWVVQCRLKETGLPRSQPGSLCLEGLGIGSNSS